MQELTLEFAQDLVVVAVGLDRDKTLAEKFLDEFEVDFEIVYDPTGAISEKYAVKGLPTSFLIDRDGEPVATHVGFNTKDAASIRSAIMARIVR